MLTCTAFAEPRPKIGIALAAAARGGAHIAGVLRTLEEICIPIDFIAGTSMGAVVGGLSASGMTLDEIEQVLETTDWNCIGVTRAGPDARAPLRSLLLRPPRQRA